MQEKQVCVSLILDKQTITQKVQLERQTRALNKSYFKVSTALKRQNQIRETLEANSKTISLFSFEYIGAANV